ncbi:MAG: DUF4271 domain-containing protein [Bacteroides sp.]|jgi:hypothetical protein|nr:DUF4271 domain-containing protein [Bacteroides sp.]
MQADRNSISRLFFFLALLPLSLALQAMPALPALVFSFPDTFPAFENSSWLKEAGAETDSTEAMTVTSTSSYYGSQHLLTAGTIRPEPLKERADLDWILWVVIASTGAIALAHLLFPSRTRQFFRATLGGRHFSQMERDGGFFDETPFWLMFFNYLLMLSLLIYLTIQQLGTGSIPGSLHEGVIFLLVLGLLIVYYPLKRMFTSFLAWVFRTQPTNEAYIKNLFLFNNLAGILILPFVVYLAYTPSLTGLYLVWGLLVLLNLGKGFRGAAIGFQQPGFSVYYLILYLCAIELAPLLILAKAATNVLYPL